MWCLKFQWTKSSPTLLIFPVLSRCQCPVHPRVEYVDVDIDGDPTRGKQTAIIDIFAKMLETVQADVVAGDKDVRTEKELLKVAQVIGEGSKQENIVADLTAPAPVRKMAGPPDTRFENIEAKVLEDKVIVEADLIKSIFFVREGDKPKVLEFEARSILPCLWIYPAPNRAM